MAETVTKSGGRDGDPLEEFLCAAEAFVANVSAAMVKAAGDDEDAPLIGGSSKVVIAQFNRVCDEVRAMYRGVNPGARKQADKFLSIQQGALMARAGEEMAKAALAKGAGRGFFGWVSQYLEEIKKLIEFIVEHLLGHVPVWLIDLLKLIDEIWDMISSLLSGIFGFKRKEIADELSARSVNTMNELAALARKKGAQRAESRDEED